MPHPYEQLPDRAFWRPAVGARPMEQIDELWTPRFAIGRDEPIATLGSCFAQHISRALIANGYNWLNAEPAPRRFPEALKPQFQFDIFSARVGNIYSTALLLQWARWAYGKAEPPTEAWVKDGRVYDPFRPTVEPDGFASLEEMLATRAQTVRALRRMFDSCSVLVFTLGLTEAWIDTELGVVYPMCPGVAAGEFDASRHRFVNYGFREIYADLNRTIRLVRRYNPAVRVLLTVSPVPLVATASREHVLVATTYSKSTLRAVAGDLAEQIEGVDYFPSYEIISSFPFKGAFYEPNLRNVTPEGVAFVMRRFFAGVEGVPVARFEAPERSPEPVTGTSPAVSLPPMEDVSDPVCDEILLQGDRD